MASGVLKTYLGYGVIADRPAAPDNSPDTLCLWWATDDEELSAWDSATWTTISAGGGGIPDAPNDGNAYVRDSLAWALAAIQTDATADSQNYVRNNNAWVLLPAYDEDYTVAGYAPLVNFANFVMLRHQFARDVDFVAGLTGSQFSATVAATASTTATIRKNGASIGTLVWAAAGTVPVVTFSSLQMFDPGDVLDVIGPATADATLAGVTMTFLGEKA